MALAELTSREAVEQALDEFDELGERAFLQKYGFGRARQYLVRRDGKLYDSKAIVGAAFGFQHPDQGPLPSSAFSGGEGGAKAKLEELGYEIVARDTSAAAMYTQILEGLGLDVISRENGTVHTIHGSDGRTVAEIVVGKGTTRLNFRVSVVQGSQQTSRRRMTPTCSHLPRCSRTPCEHVKRESVTGDVPVFARHRTDAAKKTASRSARENRRR